MNPRAAIPLIVFAAIAVLLWSGIGKDPRNVPSPLVGKPIPAFSAPALHDPTRMVSKESLLGTPYLLNVFGSWCPSCRIEHPVLAEYARRGAFKLVGFNWKDEAVDAKRWLQQFGDPYAEIFTDLDGRLGIDFGIYGAPETFVIGADGTVLHKHVGPLDAEIIERDILPLIAGSK